jgi:hypothetical protein
MEGFDVTAAPRFIDLFGLPMKGRESGAEAVRHRRANDMLGPDAQDAPRPGRALRPDISTMVGQTLDRAAACEL